MLLSFLLAGMKLLAGEALHCPEHLCVPTATSLRWAPSCPHGVEIHPTSIPASRSPSTRAVLIQNAFIWLWWCVVGFFFF